MELEKLEQIFEETKSNWKGDNAFQGLQILSKYTNNLIQAADHDIIYSITINEIIETLTEEDAISLARLNWHIDSDADCFACYV